MENDSAAGLVAASGDPSPSAGEKTEAEALPGPIDSNAVSAEKVVESEGSEDNKTPVDSVVVPDCKDVEMKEDDVSGTTTRGNEEISNESPTSIDPPSVKKVDQSKASGEEEERKLHEDTVEDPMVVSEGEDSETINDKAAEEVVSATCNENSGSLPSVVKIDQSEASGEEGKKLQEGTIEDPMDVSDGEDSETKNDKAVEEVINAIDNANSEAEASAQNNPEEVEEATHSQSSEEKVEGTIKAQPDEDMVKDAMVVPEESKGCDVQKEISDQNQKEPEVEEGVMKVEEDKALEVIAVEEDGDGITEVTAEDKQDDPLKTEAKQDDALKTEAKNQDNPIDVSEEAKTQDNPIDISEEAVKETECEEKLVEGAASKGDDKAASQETDRKMVVEEPLADSKEETTEQKCTDTEETRVATETKEASEVISIDEDEEMGQSSIIDEAKAKELIRDESLLADVVEVKKDDAEVIPEQSVTKDISKAEELKCDEPLSDVEEVKKDDAITVISVAVQPTIKDDAKIEELKCDESVPDVEEVKKDDATVVPVPEKTETSDSGDSSKQPETAEAVTEEKKDSVKEPGSTIQAETESKSAEAEKKIEEDDDIILIDDEKSNADEDEANAEQAPEQEKSAEQIEPVAKKLRLSTEEKEEPQMDTTDQETDKEKEEPKKSTEEPKSDESKSKAEQEVSEDEDVVLVECDSNPLELSIEKDDGKIAEDKTKLNEKDEADDVVVVESKASAEDAPKTDKRKSPAKDEKDKPEPDSSDDIMVVDSDEPSKDSKTDKKEVTETVDDKSDKLAKVDEKIVENAETDKADTEPSKSAPKVTDNGSNRGTPTKRIVLDENTGMFEEKEALPEESVPQVFGDSDEDVVMVDNYVTTDRKSAAKPAPPPSASKPSQPPPAKAIMTTTITAAQQTTPTPEAKKQPADKEATKSRPSTVSVECINAECKKDTRETAPAPAFVLNFFGIPKKTKKQRICLSCYDDVVQKYSVLGGAVLDQQPLLFCEMPRKNELVEISDSSEEEEDEDVKLEAEKPLSADIIALVESELNDIVSSTFEKINIGQQIEWTEQIMKQKIAYNTKLSDEINNELNELQRKVDKIHLQLYSKSRPRFQDLPPINIFEVEHNRQSMPPIQANRQYSPQRPFAQTAQQQLQQQQQQQQKQSAQVIKLQGPAIQPAAVSVSPQKEEFTRPPVSVGQFYFAVKHKLLSNWAECQIVEAVTVADKSLYKVNFLYNQGTGAAPIKVVPAKYLAYRHSFNVKLPLGTRVIARFDAGTTHPTLNKGQQAKTTSFYPGIIAESFGKYNRNRYLIFFDDGYAQYVTHGDVRVVCEESADVWTDIHPHSQEFIKNYLMNYRSQRPMVQVKVGQRIITEWKGKWIYAKVIDIDASLVQLHFPDDNRYEWIYRGSTRLGPLYQEKALSMSKASNKFSKFQKRNEPSIEYITLDDDDEDTDQAKQQEPKKVNTPQEQALQALKNLQMSQADSAIRSVAKKSTFHRPTPVAPQPSAVFMNSSTIYCEDDRPKGKIVYYTAKKHLPPLKYKPHDCNPSCLFKITHNLKSYSPMAKPLLSGWERQLCKMRYKKVFVVYRAPCGRRVRNMYELHMYLRMTKATLNVENFDFDPMIHCLAEYVIENHIYHNPDLSDGKEFMAVPCVNYFDDTKPPPCIYSTERIPTEGVNLNLDSDFLCGCDCDDDCIDKSRCQCWQMTVAGAKFGNPNTPIDNIGYVYKRLQEPVVTGIYECNSRCKCKSNCLNRVVQHPLMTKLQVFKTSNRGWGIRCLNDVAKGSFICIYSGHLLTEEAGNTICEMNENKAGDEYFADLDYIETVEQLKEGYETDVVESESEADSDEPDYVAKLDSGASDDDFTASTNPGDAAVKTRSQVRRDSRSSAQKAESKSEKKSSKKKDDSKTGSDDEREMVNLMPSDMSKEDAPSPTVKYRSVRKYFGKHEQIYIMDAKKSGNLGRYFNHSCNPNLFVQNVFVDTHDLRFPWVAFFALCNVRAGSELTWNYNYDVGSVPGKVLYCQCGAENCRQRLL